MHVYLYTLCGKVQILICFKHVSLGTWDPLLGLYVKVNEVFADTVGPSSQNCGVHVSDIVVILENRTVSHNHQMCMYYVLCVSFEQLILYE